MATLAEVIDFIDDPDQFTITYTKHGCETTVEFTDSYGLSCGSNGEWFVAGHEFGATILIHASSFEDAWGEWIDNSPTIEESEVPEAYGIDDSPKGEVVYG